jgi:excisionase family DNA binding protein
MLRLSQVAERLNCSVANCYSLIAANKLPAVSVGAGGKGLRVTEEDLQAFIEAGRHGRRPEPIDNRLKPTPFKNLNVDRLAKAWRRQGVDPSR